MRSILILFALLLSITASAQAANLRYNCTSSCTFVADAYPSTGPVPTSCKLYSGGALKASATAVAVTGGVQCQVSTAFAAGSYSVTMSAVDSAGVETAQSFPFAFDSGVALPRPANLRILGTPF